MANRDVSKIVRELRTSIGLTQERCFSSGHSSPLAGKGVIECVIRKNANNSNRKSLDL